MKKAVLYKKMGHATVRCLACAWYCRIAPNHTGVCGTRYNDAGSLYSLVYGKAIGLHMDPVEKKPLYHFLPGKNLLSFGTAGCNFGCLFCQNWEMSQATKSKTIQNIQRAIDRLSIPSTPHEIVDLALQQGASGIAYTYNEPAIFIEYACDTARLAKKKNLKNVYVSNGFESQESFDYIGKYLDAINIDLKSFQPQFYQNICKASIEPVKENIKNFFRSGIETEITTLLIPGYNDSDTELKELAEFLSRVSCDIPWHVSAFYPNYRMCDIPPTPYHDLLRAYHIGKKAGLHYIYLGNVSQTEYSDTRCPRCHEILVQREGYTTRVRRLDMQKGVCGKCKEHIYGIWN